MNWKKNRGLLLAALVLCASGIALLLPACNSKVSGKGGSGDGSTAIEREPVPDATPPVFDGIAALEVVSSSELKPSWSEAADDTSAVADLHYRVYLSDPAVGLDVDYSMAALEVMPGATQALLTGLLPDTEYAVSVRAVDLAGNESVNLEALSARTDA